MKIKLGILFRIAQQFKRQPIAEKPGNDAEAFAADIQNAFDSGTERVDEAWNQIRHMTTRANAAGAVAALALYGSQVFTSGVPRIAVFWVIVIFVAGLVSLLARNFLAMLNAIFLRRIFVERVVDWNSKAPAPIIMNAARFCDWLSVTFLAWGAGQGAYVLYSLASPASQAS